MDSRIPILLMGMLLLLCCLAEAESVEPLIEVVHEENPDSNHVKSNNFSYTIVVVVVMQPYIPLMDALVATWLPGSEGQGVADVLFDEYGSHASFLGHGSGLLVSLPNLSKIARSVCHWELISLMKPFQLFILEIGGS
ncbi:hypothetical protein QYF36_014933 [Acer negundo]|nr:hypothetical protein QYF36_014933 [Acer negundo]